MRLNNVLQGFCKTLCIDDHSLGGQELPELSESCLAYFSWNYKNSRTGGGSGLGKRWEWPGKEVGVAWERGGSGLGKRL